MNPVLQLLRTKLLSANEQDAQHTKDFKTKIMASLDEKYAGQVTDDLLNVANLVDPIQSSIHQARQDRSH